MGKLERKSRTGNKICAGNLSGRNRLGGAAVAATVYGVVTLVNMTIVFFWDLTPSCLVVNNVSEELFASMYRVKSL